MDDATISTEWGLLGIDTSVTSSGSKTSTGSNSIFKFENIYRFIPVHITILELDFIIRDLTLTMFCVTVYLFCL